MAYVAKDHDWPVPTDFQSDGCTVPWFLRWYFKKYTPACRRHDWARRHLVHYGIVSVAHADRQLYEDWRGMGMPHLIARLAWNVVKDGRSYYSRTLPLPDNKPYWAGYLADARRMEAEANGAA